MIGVVGLVLGCQLQLSSPHVDTHLSSSVAVTPLIVGVKALTRVAYHNSRGLSVFRIASLFVFGRKIDQARTRGRSGSVGGVRHDSIGVVESWDSSETEHTTMMSRIVMRSGVDAAERSA